MLVENRLGVQQEVDFVNYREGDELAFRFLGRQLMWEVWEATKIQVTPSESKLWMPPKPPTYRTVFRKLPILLTTDGRKLEVEERC